MRITEMQTMYDYHYWATKKILDRAMELDESEYAGPAAAGERNLRDILVHTLSAEQRWRMGWQRLEPTERLRPDDLPTVAALAEQWNEDEQVMRTFLSGLTDEDLDGAFRDFKLWQVMLHVVNHGTQHRSEAAMILTALGHSPGDTDLVFFLLDQ